MLRSWHDLNDHSIHTEGTGARNADEMRLDLNALSRGAGNRHDGWMHASPEQTTDGLHLEASISTASTMGEILDIVDEVTNYGGTEDFAEEIRIYDELLQRSGARDGIVDVLAARLTFAIGTERNGIPAECIEKLCAHTAYTPEFADIVAAYSDWSGYGSRATVVSKRSTFRRSSAKRCSTSLTCVAASGADFKRISYPQQCRFMQAIVLLAGNTGDYDLLEGKSTVAEVLSRVPDARRTNLEERYRYFRFDPASRRYVFDQAAYDARTPLSSVEQTPYGSPDGPGEGWNGNNYEPETANDE